MTSEAEINNAIDVAVLRQRLDSMETQVVATQKSVEEIKQMISEIKGGYKVTSTFVMVGGTILGFIFSALMKRIL